MSNEYDFQSYLYPAGSASSGGGAAGAVQNLDVKIGTVTTLEADKEATVTAVKGAGGVTLNFGIPKGAKGEDGSAGSGGGLSAFELMSLPERRKFLFPKFQCKYVPKPADMRNNEWLHIGFTQSFDTQDDVLHLQVTPILNDYRNFVVSNVTNTGFDVKCNYVPDFQGLFYMAFVERIDV